MAEAPDDCQHGPSTSGRPLVAGSASHHPRSDRALGTSHASSSGCLQHAAGRGVWGQGSGRRCRLSLARCELGQVRLVGGLAPPCLTSLPQLALLLMLLPALLYPTPTSIRGPGFLERGDGEGRGRGEGGGGSGARSRAPLAGAAAQEAAAVQPTVNTSSASAWLLMGGTVENHTDTGAAGQCGPRYSGLVEFAAAGCNKHEYK